MNYQEIIDTIKAEIGEGATDQDILDVLCDGEALLHLGITDDDQEAVEAAYNKIYGIKS